jgi:hypothetical protein
MKRRSFLQGIAALFSFGGGAAIAVRSPIRAEVAAIDAAFDNLPSSVSDDDAAFMDGFNEHADPIITAARGGDWNEAEFYRHHGGWIRCDMENAPTIAKWGRHELADFDHFGPDGNRTGKKVRYARRAKPSILAQWKPTLHDGHPAGAGHG